MFDAIGRGIFFLEALDILATNEGCVGNHIGNGGVDFRLNRQILGVEIDKWNFHDGFYVLLVIPQKGTNDMVLYRKTCSFDALRSINFLARVSTTSKKF